MPLIDIIIPTYNNPHQLFSCVQSILTFKSCLLNKIIIVNNGDKGLQDYINNDSILFIQTEKNLGWEGGLLEGLQHSTTDHVVFMNDDTMLLPFDTIWLHKMQIWFKDSSVAAVGPSSNVVMGLQNMFGIIPHRALEVKYLIGFCMMVSRKHLDYIGGIDTSLPGGDDLDLSIRFRNAGYKLIALRDLFIYHHGFQTGSKVYGSYWNSTDMTENTNFSLIRKHGLRQWIECIRGGSEVKSAISYNNPSDLRDAEKEVVVKNIKDGAVLELGCGSKKTVENALAIDIIPFGKAIATINNEISVADISGDVEDKLPVSNLYTNIIARHVLEHCIDPIKTIRHWADVLEKNGRIIITVPDERRYRTISMNPQHVHGYTPDSLDSLFDILNFKPVNFNDTFNSISFMKVYERI